MDAARLSRPTEQKCNAMRTMAHDRKTGRQDERGRKVERRSMETDEFDYLVVACTHSGPLLSNDGNALLIGVSIRRFEEPTATEVRLSLYRARLGGDRRVDGPDADGPAAKEKGKNLLWSRKEDKSPSVERRSDPVGESEESSSLHGDD
ncbi:hypothetical protein HZH68_009229 [Vespula germanica]|uniref:Uncharacterized protein n=1 Tax=Vespula germanica TaxID=30212 RepID=A0A834N4Y8_VESGE|nr:hypothetical protein HZH68_009229 [Vespula germanica]